MKEEQVREHLNKLDILKHVGADGVPHKQGTGQSHCKATLSYLSKTVVIKIPVEFLEEGKYFSLQKGQEGGARELQAGQPHLCPWEGGGANPPGNNFQTY